MEDWGVEVEGKLIIFVMIIIVIAEIKRESLYPLISNYKIPKFKSFLPLSIQIEPPDGNQTEQIIINIALKRKRVRIPIPKILTPNLHTLPLLHTQHNLYNILISIAAELFKPSLDDIGHLF